MEFKGDSRAEKIAKVYRKAESEIRRLVNRKIEKGLEAEYYELIGEQVRNELENLKKESREWVDRTVPELYMGAAGRAEEELKKAGGKITVGFSFTGVHKKAVEILAENTYSKFEDITEYIGRKVPDIYRRVALEAVRGTVIGYDTVPHAAKRIQSELREAGIEGFKDKLGREWNMHTYAKMVARTTTMEAELQGSLNRFAELEQDLIKISSHGTACEKCGPFEGDVLSITGKTRGYPTLQEARDRGLFHPNCKHGYGIYLPEKAGEAIEEAEEDPVEKDIKKLYKDWDLEGSWRKNTKAFLKKNNLSIPVRKTTATKYAASTFLNTGTKEVTKIHVSKYYSELLPKKMMNSVLIHESVHVKGILAKRGVFYRGLYRCVEEAMTDTIANYIVNLKGEKYVPTYGSHMLRLLGTLKKYDPDFRKAKTLDDFAKILAKDRFGPAPKPLKSKYVDLLNEKEFNFQKYVGKYKKHILDNSDRYSKMLGDLYELDSKKIKEYVEKQFSGNYLDPEDHWVSQFLALAIRDKGVLEY